MKKYIIFLFSFFIFFPNIAFAYSPNPDKYVSTKEVGSFIFDDTGFLPSNAIAKINEHNSEVEKGKSKIIYAVAVVKKDADFFEDFDEIDDLAKAYAEKHKTKDKNGLGVLFLINPNADKSTLLSENDSPSLSWKVKNEVLTGTDYSSWIFSQNLAAGVNKETQDFITSKFFSDSSSSIDYIIRKKARGDYTDDDFEKHLTKLFDSLTDTINKNYIKIGDSKFPSTKKKKVDKGIDYKGISTKIKKIFTLKRIVLGIFAIFGIIYVIKYHKFTKDNEKYYI